MAWCLVKHRDNFAFLPFTMKMYRGVEVQLHTFLTDGGEWSASHPGSLTPSERAPDTH